MDDSSSSVVSALASDSSNSVTLDSGDARYLVHTPQIKGNNPEIINPPPMFSDNGLTISVDARLQPFLDEIGEKNQDPKLPFPVYRNSTTTPESKIPFPLPFTNQHIYPPPPPPPPLTNNSAYMFPPFAQNSNLEPLKANFPISKLPKYPDSSIPSSNMPPPSLPFPSSKLPSAASNLRDEIPPVPEESDDYMTSNNSLPPHLPIPNNKPSTDPSNPQSGIPPVPKLSRDSGPSDSPNKYLPFPPLPDYMFTDPNCISDQQVGILPLPKIPELPGKNFPPSNFPPPPPLPPHIIKETANISKQQSTLFPVPKLPAYPAPPPIQISNNLSSDPKISNFPMPPPPVTSHFLPNIQNRHNSSSSEDISESIDSQNNSPNPMKIPSKERNQGIIVNYDNAIVNVNNLQNDSRIHLQINPDNSVPSIINYNNSTQNPNNSPEHMKNISAAQHDIDKLVPDAETDAQGKSLIRYSRYVRLLILLRGLLCLAYMIPVYYLLPFLVLEIPGYFGARGMHNCLSISYAVLLGLITALRAIAIIVIGIWVGDYSGPMPQDYIILLLVMFLIIFVFELGQNFVQIKFCSLLLKYESGKKQELIMRMKLTPYF